MQKLSGPYLGAMLFAAGALASAVVIEFPWFSFLATILAWTAMRAPESIGLGTAFRIAPARSVSDAAYEGLWAAVALVFGVTLIFEIVNALISLA